MITEDYVSFETAKLLKEKGFDGVVQLHYNNLSGKIYSSNPITKNCIKAPTLQMAIKWLREVHKIHIVVYPYGEYSCDNYQFDVYKNNALIVSKDDGYITYEQATEAAIKYCLKNLI